MVFDAAAEVNGDLLNSLVGVMLCFRSGCFTMAADVEAYFHQVRVLQEDADSLRYYWTDDVDSKKPQYSMQMQVHIFGAKDSATCAIHALRQAARDNYTEFDGQT